MSSDIVEEGGAAVSLGKTDVDLKVRVKRSEVVCTLKYKGTSVNVIFGSGGVAEILLPPGSDPQVHERAEGEDPGGARRQHHGSS